VQLEPAGPPWGWNPASAFNEAFNESKRTKMAQEKFQMEREMEQILFPLKQQKAALELDKLQAEVERQTEFTKRLRAGYSQVNPVVKGAITDPSGGGGFPSIDLSTPLQTGEPILVDFGN
jgi:hypothetical protein